jgi:hypothetical protein
MTTMTQADRIQNQIRRARKTLVTCNPELKSKIESDIVRLENDLLFLTNKKILEQCDDLALARIKP